MTKMAKYNVNHWWNVIDYTGALETTPWIQLKKNM